MRDTLYSSTGTQRAGGRGRWQCCGMLLMLAAVLCAGSCRDVPRMVEFPSDHGPHFDALSEWWYWTGDVLTVEGRRLGFECTIFKGGHGDAGDFGFIGHVAVSDPEHAGHYFSESRTSPPVENVAEGLPLIAINDFFYAWEEDGVTVRGRGETVAVDLTLTPRGEPLLHGSDGVIAMGDGRPSYYYSITDFATAGTITIDGVDHAIDGGRTWMDHQWGNFTALGLLWDWFSLRLDDGGALMLFRFRNLFGSTSGSNWTYQSAAGEVVRGAAFDLDAERIYVDGSGRCRYPLDWHISVAALEAEFVVRPLFDAQTMYSDMLPDYWEGLCAVEGSIAGVPAPGAAYVELTGYCRRPTHRGR